MAKKIDLTGLEHFKSAENAFVAPVESSSTASKAYAIGDRFWYTGKLYIATAAIASGGTITVGTNCALDVLGDDVSELKSADDKIVSYEADGKVPILTSIFSERIDANGNISTQSNYRLTDLIPVVTGERIYLSSNTRESSNNAWYTSEKVFIRTFTVYVSSDEYCIIVPENVGYVRLGNTTSTMYPQIYRKNKAIDKIAFNKYCTETESLQGFINGANGSYNSNASWRATDFVALPMPNGGNLDVVSTLYGNGGIAFYDYNKNYISGINGNTASAGGYSANGLPKYRQYIVPKNTCYVRFCIYLYDSSWTAQNMYIADAEIGLTELSDSILTLDHSIYSMNETESMYVNAGANYGHHSGGSSDTQKRFTMLVTTDVHADETALERAIDYMNVMPAFTIGTTLGDLQGSTFSDNDGTWYTNCIKNADKNWLTIVGNHDVGIGNTIAATGTEQQVYEKFIEPNLQYADVTDTGHCYYYKDNSTFKLRIICLNAYDVDDNTTSGDNYVVPRYTEYYSQAQITWLVNTLNSTPSNYQVIVLTHNTPAAATKDTSVKFNNKVYNLSVESTQDGIITDIINAWQNGTTLSQTYTCTNTNLDDVTVSADFSDRGAGVFVCYVTGHMHVDFVGAITEYPTQHILAFSATNCGTYQNGDDDLPRADNTKAEDCITALSVDTTSKTIYLTRIGSSVSKYFDVREPSAISYAT